jgi:hypothetical protein
MGPFVDYMMKVPTYDKLRDEVMTKYKKDFGITCGGLKETFLSMEAEQTCDVI